jgi:hypothetical protein
MCPQERVFHESLSIGLGCFVLKTNECDEQTGARTETRRDGSMTPNTAPRI